MHLRTSIIAFITFVSAISASQSSNVANTPTPAVPPLTTVAPVQPTIAPSTAAPTSPKTSPKSTGTAGTTALKTTEGHGNATQIAEEMKKAFEKTKEVVTRKVMIVGIIGIVCNVLAVINLIFGLINMHNILGMYKSHLSQINGKLKLATEEMASRDMHPKIKMTFMRRYEPGTSITQVFGVLKESGPFDNTNGLFTDQKESRLRARGKSGGKEEGNNDGGGGATTMQSTVAGTVAPSAVSKVD